MDGIRKKKEEEEGEPVTDREDAVHRWQDKDLVK